MDFSKIKNLIFDLGAVIIDIDIQITFNAFAVRMGILLDEVIHRFHGTTFWNDYETGKVNNHQFRSHIQSHFHPSFTEQEIDDIWNKLLLDIPFERIELLKRLALKYRLFILSNTNEIHIRRVNEILCACCGISDIKELFEKAYYSYEIGLRKPDPAIYQYVLQDKHLLAQETIFIDDNLDNIESASKLDIHTIHVAPPFTIIELLNQA